MAQSRLPRMSVTVDSVALAVRNGEFLALAVRRKNPPYKGRWALPGGFVEPTEDLQAAARRELAEETGVTDAHVEQLAVYGRPARDPRGRVLSVAHLVIVPHDPEAEGGSDAAEARWLPVAELLQSRLAFDHHQILSDAIEHVGRRLEHTPLATAFCGEEFTVAEVRRVYETVWGVELDPRNFHRKATSTPGFVKPTAWTTTRDGGRPAQLFVRGPADALRPPLLRP